jgi:hypothetical protein
LIWLLPGKHGSSGSYRFYPLFPVFYKTKRTAKRRAQARSERLQRDELMSTRTVDPCVLRDGGALKAMSTTLDEKWEALDTKQKAWAKGYMEGLMDGTDTCRSAVEEITPHVGTACHKEFAYGWNAAMRAVCEALGIQDDA